MSDSLDEDNQTNGRIFIISMLVAGIFAVSAMFYFVQPEKTINADQQLNDVHLHEKFHGFEDEYFEYVAEGIRIGTFPQGTNKEFSAEDIQKICEIAKIDDCEERLNKF